MELNDLTYKIRGAIFTVHSELGEGLLESVYESALAYELSEQGFDVKTQVALPVVYKDKVLSDTGFRLDILVEETIIIEIKSVEKLQDVHKKQLLTYLKLSGLPLGILVNFNEVRLEDKVSLVRIIN